MEDDSITEKELIRMALAEIAAIKWLLICVAIADAMAIFVMVFGTPK